MDIFLGLFGAKLRRSAKMRRLASKCYDFNILDTNQLKKIRCSASVREWGWSPCSKFFFRIFMFFHGKGSQFVIFDLTNLATIFDKNLSLFYLPFIFDKIGQILTCTKIFIFLDDITFPYSKPVDFLGHVLYTTRNALPLNAIKKL